jgi:Yip1 domain
MPADALASPPPAAPGLSQIERVVDTFVAPSKTFNDILRNASWWLPFLLLVLGSIAGGYSVQKQVGFERAFMNHLHTTPTQEDQINQLPPDQKAQRIAISGKVTAGISYGFPVVLVIGFALYSLIMWACFNFILGGQTTYWQVLAVTWYAALPYLFITALTIFTLWFGGNAETYDYANPTGTNLAFYMPDASAGLKTALAALDIFKLWSLVLQVIGMAIISKKSIAQSAAIVVGWFLLVLIVSVGLTAAFA